MRSSEIRIPTRYLAFDIDGVCADTIRLFIDIATNEFGLESFSPMDMTQYSFFETMNLTSEEIDRIIDKIVTGTHKERLYPILDAFHVLNRFVEPILFVTARPTAGAVEKWLARLLVTDQFDVIATGSPDDKKEILLKKGVRYFVEDRIQTCYELVKEGIVPILFAQPWNRIPHPFLEVSSWREFSQLLDVP